MIYSPPEADAQGNGTFKVTGKPLPESTKEIVPTATYNTFSKDEKANWHYHKDEIPKVEATLPDVAAEDAGAIVKSIEETYGKIYLLWDPSKSDLPVGKPSITVLK